eukprot:m.106215 g.106215  ORF g.106215 m.106215 type:complete len:386 (+) comp16890_c0_seq1:32-1189(+)
MSAKQFGCPSISVAALALGFAAVASAEPVAPDAPLTLLTSPEAVCMDGTPSGYYHQPATSPAARNKWVIHLQGGGECTTQEACQSRVGTRLGSSKYFDSKMQPSQLASSDPLENPALYQWHHVYVPYCSQDLHSGTVSKPSNGTFGYRFAGHLTFAAIVSALKTSGGLATADTVVLSGGSAGGIGVWINLDWLQEQLPASRVVGAPIAGFYAFAFPYTGPGHTSSKLADFRGPAWPAHVQLWGSFLPKACVAGRTSANQDTAACMLSNYSAPFVKAPLFVIEAQTDKVQLTDHDWVPESGVENKDKEVLSYLMQWHDNQTIGLEYGLKPTDGYFNPACFIHTGFSHTAPHVDGLSYAQAFGRWLVNGTRTRLADTCGILCNPKCT